MVLDYGGQYSQLIARRVRECGVFSELLPHHVGAAEVARRRPRGLILSGGPASVYAPDAPQLDPALLELGIPVLGICYGMQLIARELGGRVEGAEVGEFGRSELTVDEPGRLLAGLPRRADLLDVAPRHGLRAAAGLHRAGVVDARRRSPRSSRSSAAIYGIQFHPEVVHTPYGQRRSSTRFLERHLRLRAHVERRPRSSTSRSRASARRSATDASSAACRAASTRRSRRCSCTARSATSSRACSSTTA